MTIDALRELTAKWQTIIGLPEWKLEVRWGKKDEMKGLFGTCCWFIEGSVAEIAIARNQDDYEETLVHELLHVALEGHKSRLARYDEHYERAINRITDTLLRLERGK